MTQINPPGEHAPGRVLFCTQSADTSAGPTHSKSRQETETETSAAPMATAILPDGSKRDVADGSSVMQLAESIGRGLAKAAVAAKVDGKVVDLSSPISAGEHHVSILTDRDAEALLVLRHSTAHVMAEAIQRLWPDAKLAYCPPLDNGFYYDIALDTPISSNDFPRIEAEMQKIVQENRPFTRYDLPV